MKALSPELATCVARWRKHQRRAVLVRRAPAVLVACFALLAHAGLEGWIAKPLCLLLLPALVASVLLSSLLVWPPRRGAYDVDHDFEARDALATLMLDAREHPARPLLDAFALERARAAMPRFRRLARGLSRRAWLVALLLLFAILFFPGHKPLPGPGSAHGGGAAPSSAARGGSGGGESRASESGKPRDAREAENSDPQRARPENERADASDKGEDKRDDEAPTPPPPDDEVVTLRDHVVFPDFRGSSRTAKRRAPSIERSPGASPPQATRPQNVRRSKDARRRERAAPKWERQKERALARGRLAPWEGRFLEYWGAALRAREAKPEDKAAGGTQPAKSPTKSGAKR